MVRLLARLAGLVLAVVLLNVLLPRALPADPLDATSTGASAPLTVEARARLRLAYHLDHPLGQFVAYLQDLAHGDLGWSTSRSEPVAEAIGERLPWTLGLV